MNRRMALMLAGGCGLYQVVWVAVLPVVLGEPAVARLFGSAGLRVLGLGPGSGLGPGLGEDGRDSFAMRTETIAGWVPQLALVLVSVVSAYAVFRAAPGPRPRVRTVGAFGGAVLFAAGIAELLAEALDTSQRQPEQPYLDFFLDVQLQGVSPPPVLVAVWTGLTTLLLWTELWLARRWTLLRPLLGGTEKEPGAQPGARPAAQPVLRGARERRDAVAAGLIPVVLLALAGGLLLRHDNLHSASRPSLTFDPESALPYRPPPLAEAWSGVLYPALRMRPLPTENPGGWLATLAICLVLLAVLALALRAVVRRAGSGDGLRVFVRCWYATVLAAAVAALVEGVLLQGPAPIPAAQDFVGAVSLALAEAVRFGTVCGWVTGAAVLGAVAMRGRRRAGGQPIVEKGEFSDAG